MTTQADLIPGTLIEQIKNATSVAEHYACSQARYRPSLDFRGPFNHPRTKKPPVACWRLHLVNKSPFAAFHCARAQYEFSSGDFDDNSTFIASVCSGEAAWNVSDQVAQAFGHAEDSVSELMARVPGRSKS